MTHRRVDDAGSSTVCPLSSTEEEAHCAIEEDAREDGGAQAEKGERGAKRGDDHLGLLRGEQDVCANEKDGVAA